MPDYKNKDYLRQAYVDEGKSCQDIADECGCGSSTVNRWLEKFDIDRRARGEYGRGPDKSPLSLTHCNGYEAFQTRVDYQSKQIYVHRLLAVSEYGFDSVADQVVHHKNGVNGITDQATSK